MNPLKIISILLIAGGALGVVYGGFTYTKETHRTDIGPLHVEVQDKQRVNIPMWVGIGAIVGGALLLGSARNA
jgi:hypothetical protein